MKLHGRGVRGFTLVELSVALLIVALLLAGALIPLSTQMDVRNVAETRRSMEQIREALIGFALMNGRLPCPARGETPSGSRDNVWGVAIPAGTEQYDSANKRCFTVLGVIPWATLGTPETDAWGRRYTYRVSPAFSDDPSLKTWQTRKEAPDPSLYEPDQDLTVPASPASQNPTCPSPASTTLAPAPTQSSFALCTLGDIALLRRSESDRSKAEPLATGVPAIFVSHGKNGYGAYQPSGIALAAPKGADELANASGTVQATPSGSYTSYVFYTRDPTPAVDDCDDTTGTLFCEFDDLVVVLPAPLLVSRMVTAGKLP